MLKKNSDLIILTILWIVSIYALIKASLNSFELNISNYIGYGMLIGISVLKIFRVKRIKTILMILLIVGSVNAIQYTYSNMTLVFTWTPFGEEFSSFGMQPLSLGLLILFVVINFSIVRERLIELFADDPNIAINRYNSRVDKFYDELKNENDSKLLDIVENKNMYQIEYFRAAQKIVGERKTNT